jgi:hypothetical protein
MLNVLLFRDAIYFITVTHGSLFGSDEMHQCLQDFSNFFCQLAPMPLLIELNISFNLCVPFLHTAYPPSIQRSSIYGLPSFTTQIQ